MSKQNILIWFGRNDTNQSHFSAKVYIESVSGDTVTRSWVAANIKNRRVEMRWMRSLTLRYSSRRDAAQTMSSIVQANSTQDTSGRPERFQSCSRDA